MHVVAEHVNEVSEDRIRAVLLDPFPAGVFPAAECWLPVSVVGPAHSSRSKSSSLAGGCSTTSRRRCAYVIPSAPPRYRSLACVPGSGVKADLLLWLSLVPFTTAWMDEQFAPTPVMVYGVNLVLAGLAYLLLERSVIRADGPDSAVRQALGRDLKGRISPLIYLFGIIGSLLWVWLGIAAYVLVAVIWLVPDRRMEHYVDAHMESRQ